MLFNQEFTALLRAGLTISEALKLAADRPDSLALSQVLQHVETAVRGGMALSEACAEHGEVFDSLYLAALKTGEKTGTLAGVLAKYQGNQSLPVWDAPQAMPTDWDQWQDRAQNSSYSGQSNTEANAWAPEIIQGFVGQQTPRGQDWFRTGLTTGDLFAYTGENSPDWGQINEYDLSTAQDDTLSRVAAANEVNAPPFDPFTYGMGAGRVFNPARTNLRSGE